MESCDLFIVGAGAAGLSAARAAAKSGCGSILLADREPTPGGILRQCAHRGFGPALTGPEYIVRLLEDFPEEVRLLGNTTVLNVSADRTAALSSPDFGLKKLRFRQMILAAGCREITAGQLQIPGTRPAGVYTAGELQRDMNLRGFVPEGPAVILGSGDMGLVAAWQLQSAGIEIKLLVDQRDRCGGLARSRERLDHELPLRLRSTVSRIFGETRLEGVQIRNADTGKEEFVSCRTLVIAAGLVPDRALNGGLGQPDWLHLCGNCSSVHTMVEGVVQDGRRAGIAAREKLKG